MYTATIHTPPGPFTIVASDEAVLASGWTDDPERLRALIGAPLRPAGADAAPDLGPFTRAVEDYLAGDLTAIDAIPVAVRRDARSTSARGRSCG